MTGKRIVDISRTSVFISLITRFKLQERHGEGGISRAMADCRKGVPGKWEVISKA